jgi:N6-adenosine-specific RNA methylase IME4
MKKPMRLVENPATDLLGNGFGKFATILADPPWRFSNRTGKMAPEHKRLGRYPTMDMLEILDLPVMELAASKCHLYLWIPNALILEGIAVMKSWGFSYKTNIVWYKVRKDGGPDGRGVGFYFRNVTELVLFGVRGNLRTLAPGRRQTNIIVSRKREHSRKPDELYDIIEACSPGPYLELFARQQREGWAVWGNELDLPLVGKPTRQVDVASPGSFTLESNAAKPATSSRSSRSTAMRSPAHESYSHKGE